MSSTKLIDARSLFAGVSFSDLWRAARYRQNSGIQGLPGSLEVAHASRFAAPSQPYTADAAAVEQEHAKAPVVSRVAA